MFGPSFRTGGVRSSSNGGWLSRDVINTSQQPAAGWNFPPWGYAHTGRMSMGLGGLGDGGDSPLVADLKQIARDMPWWGWVAVALVVKRAL